MPRRFVSELQEAHNWIHTQLGLRGIHLTWRRILLLILVLVLVPVLILIPVLVLVLLLVLILAFVRNLASRYPGGSSSSTVAYPPAYKERGFPTSYHIGSKRLGDFSIKKEVYDFKVPTLVPDLSNLRNPVSLNMELAKRLFVPQQELVAGQPLEMTQEEEASIPGENGPSPAGVVYGEERRVAANSSGTSQPATPPDWELARKLFIPGFKK